MDQSHFGRLCPELRNRIYHLVLEEEDPIAISQESAVEAEAALLRTCRQIREESELIFYAVNNFSCTIHSIKDKVPHLTDWLQTGPPQKLALIRSLEVRCEFPVNVMRAMRIAARRDVLKVAVLHRPGPGSPTLVRPLFKDLRTYSFGTRRIEQVVKFTVNGTSDDAPEVDMNTLIYGKEWAMKGLVAKFFMVEVAIGENAWEVLRTVGFDKFQEIARRLVHGQETNGKAVQS